MGWFFRKQNSNEMHYILCFFLFFFSQSLLSQSLIGKIIDENNLPIAGAIIFSNAGQRNAASNDIGKFILQNVKVGDTINISYLGFKTINKTLQQDDFGTEVLFVLEEEMFDLAEINITNSLKDISKISALDLRTNPVNSSQEILRKVPGLFISQHAGGGKAEQIFLRGFDIDHGTDIAISVDGMPVNMVSHAHGQGYADLHFVIPEVIENIDFGKGPYFAEKGNFNTAGYVAFKTKDKLDQSSIDLEYGRFNTFRSLGLFELLKNKENQNAFIASEFLMTDGAFESPQNFNRLNLMGKYSIELENGDRFSSLISRFQSEWDASGQIPQRLVDDGSISRFGSVDDTEGGNTSRTNFAVNYTKILTKNSFIKSSAFFSHYDFELYSNFTFFLEDPINGDQIRQKENRKIYGLNTVLFQTVQTDLADLEFNFGLGFRYDNINDIELSHTLGRKNVLENLALGQVDETNFNGFANLNIDFGKWRINPGLRVDVFQYKYFNNLGLIDPNLVEPKTIISPKLNFIYNSNPNWQFFLKSGKGFHSNDTRVVVSQKGQKILPAAYGFDIGTIWKPINRLWINVAAWYLFLEQEFVYVGDAGIVEPSGKTERKGIDLGMRFQLNNFWFFDADINYTIARSKEALETLNRIPLAPEMTATGGLSFQPSNGFSGSIRYRYIKDRPANEDNSIIAEGYFILDANVNYSMKKITVGVSIENIMNQEWEEAQFATESRLLNEDSPVEEIHFTPGVPFFFKAKVGYKF